MRDLNPQEIEIRTQRRKAFRGFVAGIKLALMEFAEFVGVENSQTAVDQPEKFLEVLEVFLKPQDLSELDQKDKETLHLMLMYFIGQLFLHRYGGIWFLNENPEAQSFLNYVVGYFKRGSVSKKISVDTFSLAEDFIAKQPGRSLIATIKEVEEEIGLK
jgi:hypothetical protein